MLQESELSKKQIVTYYNDIVDMLHRCACKHVMRTVSAAWAEADLSNVIELLNIRGFRVSPTEEGRAIFKEF